MSLYACSDCHKRKASERDGKCPDCQLRARLKAEKDYAAGVKADPRYRPSSKAAKVNNAGGVDGRAYR